MFVTMIALGMMMADTSTTAAAETAEPAKKERLVCRDERSTGTRLAKTRKVCRTAAEWQESDERAQRDTRQGQSRQGTN